MSTSPSSESLRRLAFTAARFALELGGRDALASRLAGAEDLIDAAQGASGSTIHRALAKLAEGVSDKLEGHRSTEHRRLDGSLRTLAEKAVNATLEDADQGELLAWSISGPERLRQELMARSGTRRRAALADQAAEDYFDVLVLHLTALMAIWAMEADNHGAAERGALRELMRTVDDLLRISEATLASLERQRAALERPAADGPDFRVHTLKYLYQVGLALDFLEIPGLTLERERKRYEMTAAYTPLTLRSPDHRTSLTVHEATDLWGLDQVVLLVGEPGSGKTTLAKYAMVQTAQDAEAKLQLNEAHRVPYLVKLRSEKSLPPSVDQLGDRLTAVLTGEKPLRWQRDLLAAGRAVVVVDGMDEISEDERERVARWVESLVADFPRVRVILTSRPSGVAEDRFVPRGARRLDVLPLGREQLRHLVLYWHRTVAVDLFPGGPAEAAREAYAFLERIDRNPDLRLLCENPLLAASLCGLAALKESRLPPGRAEIYTDIVKMLAKTRNYERGIVDAVLDLSTNEAVRLLRAVAWRCQLDGVTEGEVDQFVGGVREFQRTSNRDALADERPHRVLRALVDRTGIIRDVPVGRLDWLHRSFCEFLAADHAIAAGLDTDLCAHMADERWAEVVGWSIELSGSPQRASHLVDRALDTGGDLGSGLVRSALRAASHAEQLEASTRSRIRDAITHLVPPRTERDRRQLVDLGDGAVPALRAALGPDAPDAALVVATLADIGTESATTALAGCDPGVLDSAAEVLARKYEDRAASDLARRVLSKVPPGGTRVGLRLTGAAYLDSLGNLSRRYVVETLTLDTLPAATASVPAASVPVVLLDAREVDATEAFRAASRLATVQSLWLRVPTGAADGWVQDDDIRRVLGTLRGLRLETDVVDLEAVRSAQALELLDVTGVVTGRLASLGGGPDVVSIGEARDLDLAGATRHLHLGTWPGTDLSPLRALPGLRELTIGLAPVLQDIADLALLPELSTVTLGAVPSLDPTFRDVLGTAALRFDELPWLGLDVDPETLGRLGLSDVPVGHGAAEVPELVPRWAHDLTDVTDEEITARGWDDWSLWRQFIWDADDWDADDVVAVDDVEEETADGYIVLDRYGMESYFAPEQLP